MNSICVMMLTLSSVVCVQMEWGQNPDLLWDFNRTQARNHIKRLVVLVGESIDLECQVLFTSKPVGKISWKKDEKIKGHSDKPIVHTNEDGVFVEAHFKIDSVTEDMGTSTVACVYEKGAYRGWVEAELHVHTLEIEATKEVCETHVGNIRLVFKETNGSRFTTGSANVHRRIQVKISEMTNVRSADITVDKTEYSLYLPIARIKNNDKILAMKPKYTMDGNVTDSLCGSAGTNSGTFIVISIMIAVVAVTN
eukprot:GFUD01101863.1.p1 GENE.GFUD01101863.1~~GFUD01101863.1.p1  ORF type:complete len:252 (+),score=48.56 GFUD01101863.1:180-935(+)